MPRNEPELTSWRTADLGCGLGLFGFHHAAWLGIRARFAGNAMRGDVGQLRGGARET